MDVQIATAGRSFWSAFRGSRLWLALRRVRFLRESVYFAIEGCASLRDGGDDPRACERDFAARRDPWNFDSSPSERARFARMRELAAPASADLLWSNALEIGCAEGAFSEILAPTCRQLECVDVSPTALDRARARRSWDGHVRFTNWNLRREALREGFDLIVAACVLEYILSPGEMRAVRDRVVGMLKPGGRLLVVTTLRSEVVDNAWWGRLLLRGRWINAFFEAHPALTVLSSEVGTTHVFSLLEKPPHG